MPPENNTYIKVRSSNPPSAPPQRDLEHRRGRKMKRRRRRRRTYLFYHVLVFGAQTDADDGGATGVDFDR